MPRVQPIHCLLLRRQSSPQASVESYHAHETKTKDAYYKTRWIFDCECTQQGAGINPYPLEVSVMPLKPCRSWSQLNIYISWYNMFMLLLKRGMVTKISQTSMKSKEIRTVIEIRISLFLIINVCVILALLLFVFWRAIVFLLITPRESDPTIIFVCLSYRKHTFRIIFFDRRITQITFRTLFTSIYLLFNILLEA